MAQFRILLAAVSTALLLPATALGQGVFGQLAPDRICSAQDIAEARAGTYTGPACRFSADETTTPQDRLDGAPPRPTRPDLPVPTPVTLPRPAVRPVEAPQAPERVVLSDDFFTGSLAGGVEQPGFRPVYAYRGVILIDAAGRVQTGFAGSNSTLTRQVRSLDRPVITAPVITPARAYPYN